MPIITLPTDLTGKLLIAMPGMDDPRFAGGVIFLCAHSPEGAMGVIVNKRIDQLRFADMLEQIGVDAPMPPDVPVCYGGPVEMGRGFVIHSADYDGNARDMLRIDDQFAMTTTTDVLEEMGRGSGPAQALMVLGYAGWGPEQLEDEIGRNGWLTCDATPDLVFGTDMAIKWEAALASLGVNPLMLSEQAGHA